MLGNEKPFLQRYANAFYNANMQHLSVQNPALTLLEAHQFLAELVAAGHHVYLPIFDRLEQELADQEDDRILIEKARRIAAQKKLIRDNHSAF